jgi:hypothetical protein
MSRINELDLSANSKTFFRNHGCKSFEDLVQCFIMFGTDLPDYVFDDVIDLFIKSGGLNIIGIQEPQRQN